MSERKDFMKFAFKRFLYYTNHMDTDYLPWLEGLPSAKKVQSVIDIQGTIAENITVLIWYTPTNELLIHFINEFWHPNQITCLADKDLSDEGKKKLIAIIKSWEEKFTDSVYRATMILANRERKIHPDYRGINMEEIILLAQDLIQKENEEHETARHDIGYTD